MALEYNICEAEPLLVWDTVWCGDYGDWQLEGNGAGLADDAQIHTVVVLSLFTDRRVPEDVTLPFDDDNRRGWFGDYVNIKEDLHEREMGSWLWIYERSALTDDTIKGVEDAANDALTIITDQGVAARVDIVVTADKLKGAIFIDVKIYAEDGELRYDQRFNRLWNQIFDYGL